MTCASKPTATTSRGSATAQSRVQAAGGGGGGGGGGGAGGGAWKAGAPTETTRVALVALPSASVAVTATMWSPAAANACATLAPNALVPSSNVHCVELTGDQTSSGESE